jgi:hypothetical protein
LPVVTTALGHLLAMTDWSEADQRAS